MQSFALHLEEKTHIIWDWNGTLLNDVDLCVKTISQVLRENGLSEITREHYLEHFGFPIIDYYRRLGFDFNKVDFPEVSSQFVRLYGEGLKNYSLHHGAKEFLQSLSDQGKVQSVLSAAKETDLRIQLREYGVIHFFKHIYGISDHYAASKIERGKELIAELKAPKENIVLIGDTDHDLEVANALEIDLLLVDDGHQHPQRLKKLGAKVLSRKG